MKPQTEPPNQSWSRLIGIGVVTIVMMIVMMNLIMDQTPLVDGPIEAQTKPWWVMGGRLAGMGLTMILGSWLLWHLLHQSTATLPNHHQTLNQASHYVYQIEQLLANNGGTVSQQPLQNQLVIWRQAIAMMGQTLAELEGNPLVETELTQLPTIISQLEAEFASESDPMLRADLEQMLHHYRHQQITLEQLQTSHRRTILQIERAVVVLQTVYSQLLTCRSTFQVADYQQLADGVTEELHHMQDYLEALQEVKLPNKHLA